MVKTLIYMQIRYHALCPRRTGLTFFLDEKSKQKNPGCIHFLTLFSSLKLGNKRNSPAEKGELKQLLFLIQFDDENT